ncbi:hypothetical protein [Sorangium sp. So ce1389]|uniref:hypothetical protein n=1 Tax=Sorangium sp. So ce1389 TaxID=3133336 RepID=UPI003F600ED2
MLSKAILSKATRSRGILSGAIPSSRPAMRPCRPDRRRPRGPPRPPAAAGRSATTPWISCSEG